MTSEAEESAVFYEIKVEETERRDAGEREVGRRVV